MSDPADDLIDYEEDEVSLVTAPSKNAKSLLKENGAVNTSSIKGSTLSANIPTKEIKKGSYVGIHSTGFRDFLLKPELLRAIVDCGFEHPSEGTLLFTLSSILPN